MPATKTDEHELRAPCALFIQDLGGWWSFKGIHVDREAGIGTIERHKHGKHVLAIVALELPSGHKIYEWTR